MRAAGADGVSLARVGHVAAQVAEAAHHLVSFVPVRPRAERPSVSGPLWANSRARSRALPRPRTRCIQRLLPPHRGLGLFSRPLSAPSGAGVLEATHHVRARRTPRSPWPVILPAKAPNKFPCRVCLPVSLPHATHRPVAVGCLPPLCCCPSTLRWNKPERAASVRG